MSRNAIKTALKRGPVEALGGPVGASSSGASETTSNEREALRAAAARWEAMTQDPNAHPRDRIAAGAELRRCLKRLTELDALEVRTAGAADDDRAADLTIRRLELLAARRAAALEAALADAPPAVAARVRAALDLGVVAVDADDEGGADAHG